MIRQPVDVPPPLPGEPLAVYVLLREALGAVAAGAREPLEWTAAAVPGWTPAGIAATASAWRWAQRSEAWGSAMGYPAPVEGEPAEEYAPVAA